MSHRFRYFVSYVCNNNFQVGYGNGEVSFETEIDSIENIRKIETMLKEKHNVDTLTVLNYRLI